LLAIVIFAVLPATVFGGLVLAAMWWNQYGQLEERLQDFNGALATSVELHVQTSAQTLAALGSSMLLERGDIDAFREMVERRITALRPAWSGAVLLDRDGAVLFDLTAADGRATSLANRAVVADAIRTGHFAVSRFVGTNASGEAVVAVAHPILIGGDTRYVLMTSLNMSPLADLLARNTREDSVSGVFDANLKFIARSRDSARYVGEGPIGALKQAMSDSESGYGRFPAYDQTETYSAWRSIPEFGWIVSVGVPSQPIESALIRSLSFMVVAGAAALLIGLVASLSFARRITEGLAGAVSAAQSLARGERTVPVISPIEEVRSLSAAFVDAAERLRAEAAERERAEARLITFERDARVEAERADRSKEELLATVAHELRSPLAAITNAVHLLPAGANGTAKEIIARQAASLTILANDLLDWERMMHGKMLLREERLDLSAAARDVVAVMGSGHAAHCALEVNANEPVWVNADRTRIDQLLSNLVQNALRHTGPNGTVSIGVSSTSGNARLSVSDTGDGLPPEALARIFEPFQQGVATSRGALGVGLALVKRIAELHGGTVCAQSAGVGTGSTFVVELPLASMAGHLATLAAESSAAHARKGPTAVGGQSPSNVRGAAG
jgi:signal transduction histidine kinase